MLRFTKLSGPGVGASGFMLIASLLLWAGNVYAQSTDKESVAIVELGGTADRSLTEGNSSFGPTVAVEVTPIEKWLELEAGVTAVSTSLNRMERGPSLQKTLDSFAQNGVHAWYWPRVDSHERIR